MTTAHQNARGAREKKRFRSSTPHFKGCPQKRGIIIDLRIVTPKKPNSAKRKVAKLKLCNRRKLIAYIPGCGHNLQVHSDVLVRGGRVPDLPGIHYHLIRGKLDFAVKEIFTRHAKRSKYGLVRIMPLGEDGSLKPVKKKQKRKPFIPEEELKALIKLKKKYIKNGGAGRN